MFLSAEERSNATSIRELIAHGSPNVRENEMANGESLMEGPTARRGYRHERNLAFVLRVDLRAILIDRLDGTGAPAQTGVHGYRKEPHHQRNYQKMRLLQGVPEDRSSGLRILRGHLVETHASWK